MRLSRPDLEVNQYVEIPTDEPNDMPMEDAEMQKYKSTRRKSIAMELGEDFENADSASSFDVDSCWNFVESGIFQIFAALVIAANVVMIFVEGENKKMEELLYTPELGTLLFYIFEIFCRLMFFKSHFLCGPARFVAWNMLDIFVVSVGLVEFLLPFFATKEQIGGFAKTLKVLLLMRLLRVLKIIRIFLESDLSWADAASFQSFIGLVIVFNSLLMGLETDIDWAGWFFIEQVLLVIYAFELMVRVKKQGLEFFYWSNIDFTWNWLDFSIVGSSAADSWGIPLIKLFVKSIFGQSHEKKGGGGGMNLSQVMMLMRMLRLMRILRLVKLVKTVEPLYILVTGVAAAVQGVIWVLILTIVILYAISIMATRLIGHGLIFEGATADIPEGVSVFATVADSMFTLFRVMSGAQSDAEALKIDSLMKTLPTIKFAFVFFMVTSSWTLLSILTAVVSENMISTCGTQQEELRMISHEEDRQRHMADLRELFQSMDHNGNGMLDYTELETVLCSKENAQKVAKLVRVPVRNVREVFKTLSRHGQHVAMDHFVECMLEVSKPVTELSVMKIQAQILDASNQHEARLNGVSETTQEASEKLQAQQRMNGQKIEKLSGLVQNISNRQAQFEENASNRLRGMEQRNKASIAELQEDVSALLEQLAQATARASTSSAVQFAQPVAASAPDFLQTAFSPASASAPRASALAGPLSPNGTKGWLELPRSAGLNCASEELLSAPVPLPLGQRVELLRQRNPELTRAEAVRALLEEDGAVASPSFSREQFRPEEVPEQPRPEEVPEPSSNGEHLIPDGDITEESRSPSHERVDSRSPDERLRPEETAQVE